MTFIAQRRKILIIFFFLLVFLFTGGLEEMRSNQLAINIIRDVNNDGFPWSNLQWWSLACSNPRYQQLQPASKSRLLAYSYLLVGDCESAIESLKAIPDDKSGADMNKLLLAYVYSMTGQWSESIALLPAKDIPVGNWPLRRYWGNVFLRAGVLDNNLTLIQESESLLGVYYPESSVELYDYWIEQFNTIAAFEELRRIISNLDDLDAPLFLEEYELLRKEYVALQVAANPELVRWQNMVNHFDNIGYFPSLKDNTHPTIILNQQWDDQWLLWGLDVDEDELALGPYVYVTLYWQDLNRQGNENLSIEHRLMRNLVPDAGFEWNMSVKGVRPYGYDALYKSRYPYPYQVSRNGDEQVFCLFNNSGVVSTGVQTEWFSRPLTFNRMIVAGQYQTLESGAATFGLRWRDEANSEIKNIHVIAGEASPEWQTAAQIIQIPDQAREISLHLLQYNTVGTACFDNLMMFVLEGPSSWEQ